MLNHPTTNVDVEKAGDSTDSTIVEEISELPERFRRWKRIWERKGKDGARAFEYCAREVEAVLEKSQ